MNPATAFLSFTPARVRAARIDLRVLAEGDADDRRQLAKCANGIHATQAEAESYARREGPMSIVTPDGEVLWINRERDAAADAQIATEERAYAEQLGRLTWREARPNFST
jgi:hypothetical protein